MPIAGEVRGVGLEHFCSQMESFGVRINAAKQIVRASYRFQENRNRSRSEIEFGDRSNGKPYDRTLEWRVCCNG
ncbi:hypothetical protein GCM10010869_58840 [Mesorhizobium tianshanense]|nr:hypothetical protein GCM10010869_58840 [Mesorhizobium tianshanense]